MKKYALFVIFLMPLLVGSVTVLEYNETDYINIRPQAYDPDQDKLTYFFNPPLSSRGTWQTDYGDAGIYNTKVGVSDGRLLSYRNITLIINKKEVPPEIEIISPPEKNIFLKEGESIRFVITASDVNQDELKKAWFLDNNKVGEGSSLSYQADFYSQGNHTIEVIVSDSVNNVSEKWSIGVENFDRASLLESLGSFSVKETGTAKLDLPDFSQYSLHYNISQPLGNDGEWQTSYDDAGLYQIEIQLWDNRDFYAVKSIELLVEDVDRPPVPMKKDAYWVTENNELAISLNYSDPDNDWVSLKAYNLPEGASFTGRQIRWKPGFDVVRKTNIIDDIARKFHMMNRLFAVYVNASSNNLTTVQQLKIRVFDNNRPPRLEQLPEIVAEEGGIINYPLQASDPDNDSLSFSFDKFPSGKRISHGTAGTHIVKASVSDGFLEDSKFIRLIIEQVNQRPQLRPVLDKAVNENELLEIGLQASDPDNDELQYSASPMPEGAYFRANRFIWKPPYDTVSSSSDININFTVTDGNLTSAVQAAIKVRNVNRPPVITSSAQVDDETFNTGEEIALFANVFDPDNDNLTYTWKTGLFREFQSGSTVNLEYKSEGRKTVSLSVTDGEETVQRSWEFFIKEQPNISVYRLNQ
ncbi:PKD domain-containing protein [Candidatus Woesearchaeota archaeon]|nr:PKD domain-containing protein [Candidatus Woesearchaeota archaeon]